MKLGLDNLAAIGRDHDGLFLRRAPGEYIRIHDGSERGFCVQFLTGEIAHHVYDNLTSLQRIVDLLGDEAVAADDWRWFDGVD